jgi:putative oxidoreductase
MTTVEYASAAARFAVGSLFVVAGIAKLTDRGRFADVLKSFPGTKFIARLDPLARLASTLIPATELTIGGAFALGILLWPVGVAISVLLSGFSAGMAIVLVRGEQLPCGCFGSANRDPIRGFDLVRNLALIGLTAFGLSNDRVSLQGLRAGSVRLSFLSLWFGSAVQTGVLAWVLFSFWRMRSVSAYVRHVPRPERWGVGEAWAGVSERRHGRAR